MTELYAGSGGLWVPGDDGKPRIRCKDPLPLSILQSQFNRLFYNRQDVGVKHMCTIGSSDALLPKAAAKDFAANSETRNVHEIGPGNFNFAMRFVDNTDIEGLVYTCHDFTDRAYGAVKDKLNGKIRFNKTLIHKFFEAVEDDPLYVILVEVLDDTLTEFFIMHEGQEYMVWKQPQIQADLVFPSRFLYGKPRELQGDFFLGPCEPDPTISDREYDAGEVIGLLENGRWDELGKVSHAFINLCELGENSFMPIELEFMHDHHWKGTPGSFKEYGDIIIKYVREQLKQQEDQIVSIPLDGLMFLWELSKCSKVHADFFDYGFEEVTPGIDFHQYRGQITSPVNFGLMKKAAEWLGFDVTLEKDPDYIKRVLGVDAARLVYIKRALKGLPKPILEELVHKALSHSVKKLCPEVECRPDNILGMRVERAEYEKFLQAAIKGEIGDSNTNMSEGTYHFAVEK